MNTQIDLTKNHILNLILQNTDASVLLKLTESYKTMVEAGFTYPLTASDVDECCGDSEECNSPEKPYIAGDWEGQQQDWDTLSKNTGAVDGCCNSDPTPAPFTSEPKKRKPRTPKEAPAEPAAPVVEETPELPLETLEPYPTLLAEAKNAYIAKLQDANAQGEDAGKAVRAKCVDLCAEYNSNRVSEIPHAQLREFITRLGNI